MFYWLFVGPYHWPLLLVLHTIQKKRLVGTMVVMTRKRAADPGITVFNVVSTDSVNSATTSATAVPLSSESLDHSNLQLLASSASSDFSSSVDSHATGLTDEQKDHPPAKLAKIGEESQQPAAVIPPISSATGTFRSLLTGAQIAKADLERPMPVVVSPKRAQSSSRSNNNGSSVMLVTNTSKSGSTAEHQDQIAGKVILVKRIQSTMSGADVTDGEHQPVAKAMKKVNLGTLIPIAPLPAVSFKDDVNCVVSVSQPASGPLKQPAVLTSPGSTHFLLTSQGASSNCAVVCTVNPQPSASVFTTATSPVPLKIYSSAAGAQLRVTAPSSEGSLQANPNLTSPSSEGPVQANPNFAPPTSVIATPPAVLQLPPNSGQRMITTPAVLQVTPATSRALTSSATLRSLLPSSMAFSSGGFSKTGNDMGEGMHGSALKALGAHLKKGRPPKSQSPDGIPSSAVTMKPDATNYAELESNDAQSSTSISAETSSYPEPGGNTDEVETQIVWDEQKTRELIQLYKEHKTLLTDPQYKKRSVWELITSKLNQSFSGCPHFRWNQVENKWKNMTKKYRDFLDMNYLSGTSYKCSFHDEIADVYHYNPEAERQGRAAGVKRQCGNGRNLSISMMLVEGQTIPVKQEKSSSTPANVSGVEMSFEDHARASFSPLQLQGPSAKLVKKKKYARLSLAPALGPRSVAASSANRVAITAPAASAATVDRTPFFTPTTRPILPWPTLHGQSSSASCANSTATAVLSPTPAAASDGAESNCCCSMATMLRQWKEDRERLDIARMERLEAMHQEKMSMFKEFLSTLRRLVEEK